jgi:hypothetical protein
MRNLFIAAAAVAALVATGSLASPSEAKTITKPAGVHKVVKVTPTRTFAKTVRVHKVVKVMPTRTFAKMVCHRGSWRHHGRCVVVKRHHNHHAR